MKDTCSWPISYAMCGEAPTPDRSNPTPDKALFERVAVEYLWQLTGGVFGTCPILWRPCRENVDCWTCTNSCACLLAESVGLPGPVVEVTEVLVDGVALPDDSFFVRAGRWLVRADGEKWPLAQDLTLPDSEKGTWSVAYVRGIPVPPGGQVAAGVLARELLLAACSEPSCQLPRNVQSVSRQGVTVNVEALVEEGRTGIWLVDSWVASIIEGQARTRGGRVYSVDLLPSRRGTS